MDGGTVHTDSRTRRLHLGELFTDLVAIPIPVFLSFKATQTNDPKDDTQVRWTAAFRSRDPELTGTLSVTRPSLTLSSLPRSATLCLYSLQWLMYWSIYGLLKLVDHVDGILNIIPLFPVIKVRCGAVWCGLFSTNLCAGPVFSGRFHCLVVVAPYQRRCVSEPGTRASVLNDF